MLNTVKTKRDERRPAAEVTAPAALVKSVMDKACGPAQTLSVPLVVETGHARNWDEAH